MVMNSLINFEVCVALLKVVAANARNLFQKRGSADEKEGQGGGGTYITKSFLFLIEGLGSSRATPNQKSPPSMTAPPSSQVTARVP